MNNSGKSNKDSRITNSINRQIDRRNRRSRNPYRDPRSVERARLRRRSVNLGTVLIAALICIVIAVSLFVIITREDKPGITPGSSSVESVESGSQSDSSSTDIEPSVGFTAIELSSEKIHEGFLILVNYEHEYHFPESVQIVGLYGNKSKYLKLSNASISLESTVHKIFNGFIDDFYTESGCNEILFTSGFRDYDAQKKLFDDRVASKGEEEARKFVALPGFSEHHTGYALDLTVLASDGLSYSIATYEKCTWFVEHAEDYGFILRYPQDKVEITKIGHEPWHYRYVGVPHAEIMNLNNFCHEEYNDYLKTFEYGKKYLQYSDGVLGQTVNPDFSADYTIYYVPASTDEATVIYVPENAVYEISGNNTDGFIVTVYSSEE